MNVENVERVNEDKLLNTKIQTFLKNAMIIVWHQYYITLFANSKIRKLEIHNKG